MKLAEARRFWALILTVAVAAPAARALWLNLPNFGPPKCISEKLYNNVMVMGSYVSFYGDDDAINGTLSPTISVKVSSPFGKELHQKEKVSYGQFAFTTTEPGIYWACFAVDGSDGKTVSVMIDWKTGIAAQDWDSVAKKEKIQGLELELKKLQGSVESIQQNMVQLMTKELEMRTVSDRTKDRVAQYSSMSLGVCIVISLLQLWYLRRYFRKKKLI